jgi:hypothetical protein
VRILKHEAVIVHVIFEYESETSLTVSSMDVPILASGTLIPAAVPSGLP